MQRNTLKGSAERFQPYREIGRLYQHWLHSCCVRTLETAWTLPIQTTTREQLQQQQEPSEGRERWWPRHEFKNTDLSVCQVTGELLCNLNVLKNDLKVAPSWKLNVKYNIVLYKLQNIYIKETNSNTIFSLPAPNTFLWSQNKLTASVLSYINVSKFLFLIFWDSNAGSYNFSSFVWNFTSRTVKNTAQLNSDRRPTCCDSARVAENNAQFMCDRASRHCSSQVTSQATRQVRFVGAFDAQRATKGASRRSHSA